MNDEITLEIPRGYIIKNKEQTLKKNKALALLCSKAQKRYSMARNNNDGTITLFYSVAKCPYCNLEISLDLSGDKPTISKEKIYMWASEPQSMCGENSAELRLYGITDIDRDIICPNCINTCVKARFSENIKIRLANKKIKVSHKIADIADIIEQAWMDEAELCSPFVYYESVIFNFGNGHTYVQIENEDGKKVCVRDITSYPEKFNKSIIYKLLGENHFFRKEIKSAFKKLVPFCINSRDITFDSLVLATRFIGYDSMFYKAIPFCTLSYKLYPGFRDIAKKMHSAANLPQLYKELKLPSNKGARRECFKNPGLLFYHNEIKKLKDAVNNMDYFNLILSYENIYLILAQLSCYPVIFDYLTEVYKYNGNHVTHQMREDCKSLFAYAILYMSMSDNAKNNTSKYTDIGVISHYSEIVNANWMPSYIKFYPQPSYIENCEINGYTFSWLISTNDYIRAGREMNNCIGRYYQPVIVVKYHLEYVAAISLNNSEPDRWEIESAYMCSNVPIGNNSCLYDSVVEWCRRFNIIPSIPTD